MNRDTLCFHAKTGVIIPSTNTFLETELAAMHPAGVSNHMGHMIIHNTASGSDTDFATLAAAPEGIISCVPDCLSLGLFYETCWPSPAQRQADTEALREELGVGIGKASSAMIARLQKFDLRQIAVLPPCKPIGDAKVRGFFEAVGSEVVGI